MKVLSDVVLLVFTSKHLSSVFIPLVAKTRSDTSGEMDQTASPACAGSDITVFRKKQLDQWILRLVAPRGGTRWR